MSATADLPSDLEYLGVTDCEMVVRMRLPTNLHQKEMALKLYSDLHRALFGGEADGDLQRALFGGADD